jgi:hypothetical protein
MKIRFSIRDLLLIMAIIGLAIGWWLDHRMQSEARRWADLQRDITIRMFERQSDQLDKILEAHPEFAQSGKPSKSSVQQ